MKLQLIPNKELGWDKLLSHNTRFIPKSEQNPEKLALLGSTPPNFKYEKVKVKFKEYEAGLN
jgi:hypothetical protein